MADKAWKRHERATAALFGGRRHLRGGDFGEAGPDCELPAAVPLAIECKYRAKLPGFLLEGLKQAAREGRPGTVPVLVLKQRRQRGALAVLALEDLADLATPKAIAPAPNAAPRGGETA